MSARTINVRKCSAIELNDAGYLGSSPQFEVVIYCARGASADYAERLRVVMPLEQFVDVNKQVQAKINRMIAKSDYLKGLIDEKAAQ
jgi:hypothetical protein